MNKLIGHFRTITKHRHLVIKHCFKAGIGFQGLFHDLSKYSPTEFIPGVKYYTGKRSPNEGEREEIGYSMAWMHHKGRNRHHFEFWCDYNINTKMFEPCEMPDRYIAEMFCDRVAASKIYLADSYTDQTPLSYFSARVKARFIHPSTEEKLRELLVMLAEKGEDETFRFIKENYSKK